MPTLQKNEFAGRTELLPRIAQADKVAAQDCVDAYGAMVWALVKQKTFPVEATEKIVQEIFFDVWENAAFCDLTVFKEEIWIAMIAQRRLSRYSSEVAAQT